jgi:hypothetical protein
MGRVIVEKQQALGRGMSVMERLSADLQVESLGLKGFSANNHWLMRQFYTEYGAHGFIEADLHNSDTLKPRPRTIPKKVGLTSPCVIHPDNLMLSYTNASCQPFSRDCNRHPLSRP